MTESDGGYLVPDEYVIPIYFRLVVHPDKQVQERKNGHGIWAWFLRLIGNENGYVWVDTPEYLEFKAQWEREHARR